MKNLENWSLMMSAAKQYYQLGMSQDSIAKNLYISKSTVSRLIKRAVELGYIEFRINGFSETDEMLEHEFNEIFGIESHVLPTLIEEDAVRLNDVCAFASNYIFSHLANGGIIGVPWGRTMEYLAANIREPINQYSDIKVCMLNGFVNGSIHSMKAIHIIEKMSDMLNAKGYVMPCPLLVSSPEVKKILLDDPGIKAVYDLSMAADTIIFSVGPFDMQNTYLTELGNDVISQLRRLNGAGNFAGHTYDINGREFHTELSDRLISMSIGDIAKKERRICIAVGDYKARAVLGLLRGRIINCLYTDTKTAKAILREHKRLLKQ